MMIWIMTKPGAFADDEETDEGFTDGSTESVVAADDDDETEESEIDE